jgi:hypothetical protein
MALGVMLVLSVVALSLLEYSASLSVASTASSERQVGLCTCG